MLLKPPGTHNTVTFQLLSKDTPYLDKQIHFIACQAAYQPHCLTFRIFSRPRRGANQLKRANEKKTGAILRRLKKITVS